MPDGTSVPRRKGQLAAGQPKVSESGKAKILIYGLPAVGKTWASLDFPGVYYIDTEGGARLKHYQEKLLASGGVYMGPEDGSLDMETVIDQIRLLTTNDHPFGTVVVDSASKMFNSAISEESERITEKGGRDEFGASKKAPVRQMNRMMRWLDRIDMNVVFIAHEKPLWGKDDKGNREEIGTTFDCWEKLGHELDLILRITKFGIGEHAKRFATVGKTRLLGFPEGLRFQWSYDDFADRYGRHIIERKMQKEVLATPEQLAELKRLFEIVRLPEGQEDKWLSAAKAESWEEVETGKAQKAIEALKARMQG